MAQARINGRGRGFVQGQAIENVIREGNIEHERIFNERIPNAPRPLPSLSPIRAANDPVEDVHRLYDLYPNIQADLAQVRMEGRPANAGRQNQPADQQLLRFNPYNELVPELADHNMPESDRRHLDNPFRPSNGILLNSQLPRQLLYRSPDNYVPAEYPHPIPRRTTLGFNSFTNPPNIVVPFQYAKLKPEYNPAHPERKMIINSIPYTNKYGPLTVSIEGNIGSGKSSVVEQLAQLNPEHGYVPEQVNLWSTEFGNRLLERFYQNPLRYSFEIQNKVCQAFYDAHLIFPNRGELIRVMERSVRAGLHFSRVLRQRGYLTYDQFRIIDRWIEIITASVPMPNFTIYLRTSPATCMDRIQSRARPGEDKITMDYLVDLHDEHDFWLMPTMDSLQNRAVDPVYVIDGEQPAYSSAIDISHILETIVNLLEIDTNAWELAESSTRGWQYQRWPFPPQAIWPW
jgi:thymidine kinase